MLEFNAFNKNQFFNEISMVFDEKKPSFEIGRFNTVSDRDFHFASYGDLPNNVLNDLYESCDK